MIWSSKSNLVSTLLLLSCIVCCLLYTVHCGYSDNRFGARKRLDVDPLAGRSRSASRYSNKLSSSSSFNPTLSASSNSRSGKVSTENVDRPPPPPPPPKGQVSSSKVSETLSPASAPVSSSSSPPSSPSTILSTLSPSSSEPSDDGESSVSPLPTKFPEVTNDLTRDMLNIVASNNQFGFKLFKALAKFHGSDNLFISPLSLFSTLVTVYAGSSASTEDEMISLLQLRTMTETQIQTAFRDVLHTLLYGVGSKNNLKLLNAIFIDKELNVSSSYVDKIRTYYNAYLEKVGFSTEPAYVTQWANDFVSWFTQGLIPNLLDTPLDPLTRLLLINVIYFKGVWSEPFNPTLTNDQTVFRNFDRTTSKVPMMRSTSTINYHCDYVNVKACVIEKLYSGGSLSFLVITPTNGTDLTQLEASLGSQLMYELISQLQQNTVELGLPRFTISGSYDLLKPLEYLGMKAAFSPKKADLSKMGNSKELFVKEAKHKTVLQVTEEGTLAAGATVAEIGTRKRSPRIVIDRPFIFLIRDLRTDAILFLGRVNSLA